MSGVGILGHEILDLSGDLRTSGFGNFDTCR